VTASAGERNADRWVLGLISGGLILILLGILLGLFLTPRALPNWAENVLVSIATASALKLGDCLATLVALASGRQVERLGNQLAGSSPPSTEPQIVTIDQPDSNPVPTKEA
jgi:dolichol kinase